MPTILRVGAYRIFFYSGDRDEPSHVHVEREDKIAKFWLDPVRLQKSGGFHRSEIGRIQRMIEEHTKNYWRHGMNTSTVEIEIPLVNSVKVTEDTLSVELSDGRTIAAPLARFPRLLHSTLKERKNWRLIGKGHGIHWKDIDEDISVEGLLAGKPSGESQASFKKWTEERISPRSRH